VTNNLLQLTLASAAASTGVAWFTTPVDITLVHYGLQLPASEREGRRLYLHDPECWYLRGWAGRQRARLWSLSSRYHGRHRTERCGQVRSLLQRWRGRELNRLLYERRLAYRASNRHDRLGVRLNSGHVMHAHITYDWTRMALVLTDTVTSPIVHHQFNYQYPIDCGCVDGPRWLYRCDRRTHRDLRHIELDAERRSHGGNIQPVIAKPVLTAGGGGSTDGLLPVR